MLSHKDLHTILQKKYKCGDFEVVEQILNNNLQSSGFYGFPRREYIAVKLQNEKIIGLHMFIREMPKEIGYHKDLIEKLKMFSKETVIYDKLLHDIKEYSDIKVFPECYLVKKNKMVVLEDCQVIGYKSLGIHNTFNTEQIEETLKALGKLHAGSIIFEEKTGLSLDKCYTDGIIETDFVSDIDHPWFHSSCVAMNAIEAIVEAYFPHTSSEVYEKAYDIIRSLPYHAKQSKKYRNVLSHGCTTCDNVLFKTNDDNVIIECVITGFQHARYNTPALDVLLTILLTTNNVMRTNNFESLLVHYYNNFCRLITECDIDIKNILNWDQFRDSVKELMLTSQAMAIMYMHQVLLPKDKISQILKSDKDLKEFIETDRTNLVLEEMRNNNIYRKRMIQLISYLFDTVEGNIKILKK